jgi:hypothetical protein
MDYAFDEMAYSKVMLGSHESLLITSNKVKCKILHQMCLSFGNDNIKINNIVNCQKPLDLTQIIITSSVLQNPHVMYCTIWNNINCTFILEKHSINLFLVWERFTDQVYTGTIFDGFFIMDDKYYSNIIWSIESFKLPLLSEEEILKLLLDNDDDDEIIDRNVSTSDVITTGDDLLLLLEIIEEKQIVTELMNADDFIKAKMVREAKRQTKCTFFIRMVYQLCGERFESHNQTFKLTKSLNTVLENDFEKDNTFNNCDLISWLDQIWAYECYTED